MYISAKRWEMLRRFFLRHILLDACVIYVVVAGLLQDSYYINRHYMLRSQTTCHTSDLIASGLDRFITVGDVYRRDTIDRTHYPVFHQMDVTRLYNSEEVGSAHQLLNLPKVIYYKLG